MPKPTRAKKTKKVHIYRITWFNRNDSHYSKIYREIDGFVFKVDDNAGSLMVEDTGLYKEVPDE